MKTRQRQDLGCANRNIMFHASFLAEQSIFHKNTNDPGVHLMLKLDNVLSESFFAQFKDVVKGDRRKT